MTERMRMQEQAVEAVKNVPPLTVGALTFLGVPVDHVIQMLTVCWLLLLIAGKLWDIGKSMLSKRRARKRGRDAHARAVLHRMQDEARRDQ